MGNNVTELHVTGHGFIGGAMTDAWFDSAVVEVHACKFSQLGQVVQVKGGCPKFKEVAQVLLGLCWMTPGCSSHRLGDLDVRRGPRADDRERGPPQGAMAENAAQRADRGGCGLLGGATTLAAMGLDRASMLADGGQRDKDFDRARPPGVVGVGAAQLMPRVVGVGDLRCGTKRCGVAARLRMSG